MKRLKILGVSIGIFCFGTIGTLAMKNSPENKIVEKTTNSEDLYNIEKPYKEVKEKENTYNDVLVNTQFKELLKNPTEKNFNQLVSYLNKDRTLYALRDKLSRGGYVKVLSLESIERQREDIIERLENLKKEDLKENPKDFFSNLVNILKDRCDMKAKNEKEILAAADNLFKKIEKAKEDGLINEDIEGKYKGYLEKAKGLYFEKSGNSNSRFYYIVSNVLEFNKYIKTCIDNFNDCLEKEKLKREKLEREKLEREKLEREKLEREKLEREKFKQEEKVEEQEEEIQIEKESYAAEFYARPDYLKDECVKSEEEKSENEEEEKSENEEEEKSKNEEELKSEEEIKDIDDRLLEEGWRRSQM